MSTLWRLKKLGKLKKNRKASAKGIDIIEDYEEYFIFNPKGIDNTNATGARVAVDAITYCPSGIIDQNKNLVLSYLHKAIKPVNQLRMIEDAVVIYRIARAPERRIFKIDVGNLPKQKAEAYLKDVMNRYRKQTCLWCQHRRNKRWQKLYVYVRRFLATIKRRWQRKLT